MTEIIQTYIRVGQMRWKNENAMRTNIVTLMAERLLDRVEVARKGLSVFWVTEYDNRVDAILRGGWELRHG